MQGESKMKKLTAFEYSLKTLSNHAFKGSDKETLEVQVALGKKLIPMLPALSTMEGVKEFSQSHVLEASNVRGVMSLSNDILNHQFGWVPLDTASSQSLITSAITRDNRCLNEIFHLNTNMPSDIYTTIGEEIRNTFNLGDIPRKVIKKALMAWGYGGSAGLCSLTQTKPEQLERVMEDISNELGFQGIYAMRQACLDAWDEDALEHEWELPDGYEIHQVITQDTFARDMFTGQYVYPAKRVEITLNGKQRGIDCRWSKVGKRSKKESGTRSIGANLIHSLDAFLMRELVRRCKQDFVIKPEEFKEVIEYSFDIKVKDPKAEDLYRMWQETNVVSLNILNHLSYEDYLPRPYWEAICQVIDDLPKEGFDIRPIHDEFACLPRYANEMRYQFNHLIAELYLSTILQYFSKQFRLLDIKPIDEAKPEMVKQILEADYLLS